MSTPSTTDTPLVAIIIVNYKGRSDTLECLASLQDLTYPCVKVIVVDQASGDETPEAVRTRFPKICVIENQVNNGFAGGNNIGIQKALSDGADYIFLLNNDTTVAPNLLEPLVAVAENDSKVGMVGPMMLYHVEPEMVWAFGATMGAKGESILLHQGERANDVPQKLLESDFVVGCGLLVRRTVCETIGLMDDRFFLYYEETDWCARVKAAGWRIVSTPDARLWHKVSRSTGTESELTLYYMRRNALLYLQKNGLRDGYRRALRDSVRLALVWLLQGKRRRSRVLMQAIRDAQNGRFGKSSFTFR